MAAPLHFLEQEPSEPSRLLTYTEAARILRRSPSWLQKKVANREVPHRRLGHAVMFTPEDLTEIVRLSLVRPGEDA